MRRRVARLRVEDDEYGAELSGRAPGIGKCRLRSWDVAMYDESHSYRLYSRYTYWCCCSQREKHHRRQ